MTREEYEKQQSVIRRVFDPDTGRHRYVQRLLPHVAKLAVTC